jgi:glucose-1-phosphate cytidylyltransferase
MKVVILAGGLGTRLSEETTVRPKPMVDIGNRPILWHIMKIYAAYGFTEFVILGGYRVEFIRDYFLNYRDNTSDFTIDLESGKVAYLNSPCESWKVTVLDTGKDSMTGGRIKRARQAIGDEPFFLTYGDGVSDVNIRDLLDFHRRSGAWATLTAVVPPGRYGVLALSENGERVQTFREKDSRDVGMISGGFFVCEPQVFDLIDHDLTVWEEEPMARMVERGKLASFRHNGFWQAMDTLRDKFVLEKYWESGQAPWKKW